MKSRLKQSKSTKYALIQDLRFEPGFNKEGKLVEVSIVVDRDIKLEFDKQLQHRGQIYGTRQAYNKALLNFVKSKKRNSSDLINALV